MLELLRETWEYAKVSRKWWLLPLLAVLLLLAGLVIAVEGGAVFLYPLF
jgi:hypothetical protein